ncbi:DUF4386 family protein [Aquimarina algicola]|uniref:DUF4386 family protein n=1 Tax=Aquimarina algicola TaxID=2589995 RepID=A0A504JMJ7_9FLAO|nr:DUF4386 family protein [Aquimarina algicola]TPN88903.1 DUF4386 family protein [Aquimarina algicola]
MESKKLQRIGGICAIFEGVIYIVAFIMYGGILVYPNTDANAIEKLNFLSGNYLILSLLNLMSYILFGILLTILVLAVHQRLKKYMPNFSKLTFVFGVIWVGFVIASGMITNIGLNSVIEIGKESPENAMQIWSSINIVAEGLGGGNEIVGGIWVLFLSSIAWKKQLFSKSLTFLGLLVGIAGVLTVYPLDIFTEIFGISQIIWFLWIGIFMIRTSRIES